jgi:hypothetical protein
MVKLKDLELPKILRLCNAYCSVAVGVMKATDQNKDYCVICSPSTPKTHRMWCPMPTLDAVIEEYEIE